ERARRLSVNGQEATVSAAADRRPYGPTVRGRQCSEAGLNADAQGPALAMLGNGARAGLRDLRAAGATGFSSRNPPYSGPPDALMEFVLENGQVDDYPMAWTLPVEQTIAACEYFVATQGDRSPEIVWHDDAIDDEA